jgi:2-keto-4-pentenoate hydratase/2-oxohepta-3-ene-1,7-dioic acid hydratase in catechol pathway
MSVKTPSWGAIRRKMLRSSSDTLSQRARRTAWGSFVSLLVFLEAGDVMEVEIDGLGTLRDCVV